MSTISGDFKAAVIQESIEVLASRFSDNARGDLESVVTKVFGKLDADDLVKPVNQTVEKVVELVSKKLSKKEAAQESLVGADAVIPVAAGVVPRATKDSMITEITHSLCQTFAHVDPAIVKKAVSKVFAKLNDQGKIDLEDPVATIVKVIGLATKKILKKAESTGDDSDDEDVLEGISGEKAPDAWKRHVVLVGSGVVASAATTFMPDTTIAIIATLAFFKFVKGYALHVPRFRRITCLSLLAGGSIALQHYVPSVNLIPILGGLGLEAAAQTGKAWMKGKMDKDAGPQETYFLFKVAETATTSAIGAIGSGLRKTWAFCVIPFVCCSRRRFTPLEEVTSPPLEKVVVPFQGTSSV